MQDDPNAKTLVDGVSALLAGELLSTIEDRNLAFRVRIAAHLLQTVSRELATGEAQDLAENARLMALLGQGGTTAELNRALCAAIRAGNAPEGTPAHIRATLKEKLAVVNPRFELD